MTHTRRARSKRTAFTLVELLVVIALMLVLAGITVMFWPGLNESQRAAEGASAVQGWLKIAKQRALRDQAPRGVRFYITKVDGFDGLKPYRVSEAQYIEEPQPDFAKGTVSINSDVATLSGPYLDNGLGKQYWPVQVGDHIEITSTGVLKRIIDVSAANKLKLSWPDSTPTANSFYKVIRAPRPSSEEKLSLPKDIVIDVNTNLSTGYAAFNGNQVPVIRTPDASLPDERYIDVLFAPSGNVIGDQASLSYLNLWVRDIGKYPSTSYFDGEPTIIAVYIRSGLVAAYPPNQSGDPYAFVKLGGTTQ